MAQAEVERFLGRLITDADFRGRAAEALKVTCYHEGMVLSAQELSFLGQLDYSLFGPLADTLDDAIRRR